MPFQSSENQNAIYEQAVARLLDKLAQHPTVIAFQAAQVRLKEAENLHALEVEMKELAKQATLYQKIDKPKAYQETTARSKAIEARLNDEPLIIDYRRKLSAVNDLLQHLLQTLEIQINEELYRET